MLKLSICDYVNSLKRNLLAIIQLLLVFVLITIFTSVLFARTGAYKALCTRVDGKQGVIVPSTSGEVFDRLIKVKRAVYAKSTYVSYENEKLKNPPGIDLEVYDKHTAESMPPVLQSGRWVDSFLSNSDYVQGVIFPNYYGIGTGDTVSVKYEDGEYTKEFKLKITGVANPEQYIYEAGRGAIYSPEETDYTTLLNKCSLEEENSMVIITTDEELKKSGVSEFTYTVGNAVIEYEDDITGEEIEQNDEAIKDIMSEYFPADNVELCPLKEFLKNSRQKLKIVLITYIPILTAVVLLVFCSLLGYEYLCSSRAMTRYSVYYMLGMQWKKIALLSAFRNAVNAVFALLVFRGIYSLIWFTPLPNYVFLSCDSRQQRLMLTVSALFVLGGTLIPVRMLRNTSPDEVIRDAKLQS